MSKHLVSHYARNVAWFEDLVDNADEETRGLWQRCLNAARKRLEEARNA